MAQHSFEIPFTSKSISCILSRNAESDNQKEVSPATDKPSLIFTHGAGGTLTSEAIANFASGFATRTPVLCFKGNMNLKSRVKMFSQVMENQDFAVCLGGRSMGARAAVMAATSDTKILVLASYPLHTNKETRDQILLDISPATDVLFIEGDRDSMCDLSRLDAVRKKMNCKTWLLVVQGADHGMSLSPKSAVTGIGRKAGDIAAEWIKDRDSDCREGKLFWDEEVKWSGWTQVSDETSTSATPEPTPKEQKKGSKRTEGPTELDERRASTRKRHKV